MTTFVCDRCGTQHVGMGHLCPPSTPTAGHASEWSNLGTTYTFVPSDNSDLILAELKAIRALLETALKERER